MSGIGQNRVFDKAALQELKEQGAKLMDSAREVTEELKEEMEALAAAAEGVPPEAVHPGLSAAAAALKGSLKTDAYEDMKQKLSDALDKLCSQIPAYDSRSGEALKALSAASAGLAGMLKDLKELVGQGSLALSLEEFKGKLEEYEREWEKGVLDLEGKMLLAMTYLKGLVYTSCFSRDPVNLSTGNFYYEKEDLRIGGLKPLAFKRYYNAMDRRGGSMGRGWSHTHGERIFKEGEELILQRADGKESAFRKEGEGYRDIRTGREEIRETEEGYACKEPGGDTLTFSREGRLLKREDGSGNGIRYAHDGEGRLISARTSKTGGGEGEESLSFAYDGQGFLREVKDHTGRKMSYFYLDGFLSEAEDPEGDAISYRYGENGKIRAVKNARGILAVRNEYDERGRIIRQRFPDKGEMHYEYKEAENETILTERNGSRTIYVQDKKLRNVKTIYHDGSMEEESYDERDLKTSHRDRNGNTTRYSYDEKGNLKEVSNALGERTGFAYNGEGKLLCVSLNGRKQLENTYDEKGRLTETRDALLRSRKTAYDERGLPVLLIQPDGSRTELFHDEKGNLIKARDPYGTETCYAYDALNRITETRDGEGNTTFYEYDRKDRLIRATDPEGRSRSYAYNESGKVVKMTDFDGGEYTIAYNSIGRPECLADKEGRKTIRSYDLMWNVKEEISPCGASTRYAYDKDNRPARVEVRKRAEDEEAVSVAAYAYDPAGNLLKVQAGDGKEVLSETSYAYDALNRVTEITDPAGGRTVYAYDREGHVCSITDPAGNRRTFTYNEAGELVEETDVRGNTTRYEYNLLGQLSSVTDGAGRRTEHVYLPGGRLEKTLYPDGREMRYTYDRLGRIAEKTDGQGYTLSYAYDCMGRVLSVASSAGQKKSYTYDVTGNVASMTDANGNTTQYEYTLSGKLKAVTDALGNRAEYAYDNEDRLIYICRKGKEGEENRETFYERNPLGQVECIRDGLGNEEHYSYDALGRTIIKTDRDGYRTEYDYTGDGKIKNISYGDGTSVEMEYTALRQLAFIKDWLGETKISRDTAGRITDVTDHKGRKVSYEWGSMGERRSITYPDGNKAIYEYDEMLRLKKMQMEKNGEEIRYSYDELGRISEKQFPEGLRTRWLYDGRGQLAELVHEDDHGILDRYQYEYDLMGNKTAITKERRGLREESGRYEYGYDGSSRLTSVSKDGDALRSYTYDSFGNRSYLEDYRKGRNTSCHYDALDRLVYTEERQTGSGPNEKPVRTDYAYDNRGNLIREEAEGRLVHGYEYGAMNRLSKAWNGRGQESVYLYNGLGQRTGRSVNGEEEDYLLDLTRGYHNLLGIQKNESGQRFYFDGNVAAMEETTGKTAGGRGRDAGREALSILHYYLQDELGSPLRVSGYGKGKGADIPGYLIYGYDEFGNDLGNDLGRELEEEGIPNPYDRQGEEQPFGYTGYRYDGISGTYFAQAREYQTGNGRFTAEDVIKGNGIKPETLNRYGYCWKNPLVYVDKNGMQPEESEDESQKWMENRGHSYWYTEKGLHEGNVALPLDSDKLRMSEQGKEVLKGFELDVESEWNEDIVVRDEITNEVVAVYPYYVGDGGITFGYGHYMNYDEVMEYQTEKDLFTKYVNGKEIDSEIFDDGLGLKVKPRIVPGSVPVPLEELNQLFEEDVEKMTGDMLKNFDKTDLMLTIQQVDALVLIRFNTGHLGSDLVSLVENGATKEEWDKIINSQSSDRKLSAKDIYWGNIFTYNEYLDERNCIE